METTLVSVGTENLTTLCGILERLGGEPRAAATGEPLARGPLVVAASCDPLSVAGILDGAGRLDDVLRHLHSDAPTLLLGTAWSLMAPRDQGAGPRILDGPRVLDGPAGGPGWFRVRPRCEGGFLRDGFAFAPAVWRWRRAPEEWSTGISEGGTTILAAERGADLACQVRPEKSGAWGVGLLRRWVMAAVLSADQQQRTAQDEVAGPQARQVSA